MNIFDVKKYASKRLMHVRYFAAQIRVVEMVAGEYLLAHEASKSYFAVKSALCQLKSDMS